MTLRPILEWFSLLLLMGLGFYTMWVIKNEKKSYLKNAREIHFHLFKFFIPSWWGEVATDSSNVLCFKRLDTRYEWVAHFHWITKTEDLEIIELFKKQIADRHILFDEESSIIYNPTDFKEGALIKSGRFEIVRLEGTATANREERLYYDAFLIRELSTGHYLYAESKSSVLNGLIEGPYFEEALLSLQLL